MSAELLLYRCDALKAWLQASACKENRARRFRGIEIDGMLACHDCPGIQVLSDRHHQPPRRIPVEVRPDPHVGPRVPRRTSLAQASRSRWAHAKLSLSLSK